MLERGGQYSKSKLPDVKDPKPEAGKRLNIEGTKNKTKQNKKQKLLSLVPEKQQTNGPIQGRKERQGQVMQGFLCLHKELTFILTSNGKPLRGANEYKFREDTVFLVINHYS